MSDFDDIGREFDGMFDCAVNWIADDADKGADVPGEWRRVASVVNLVVNDHDIFRPALEEIEAMAESRDTVYLSAVADGFREFVDGLEMRAGSAAHFSKPSATDGLAGDWINQIREAAEHWVQDEDREDREDAEARWRQVCETVDHVVGNDALLSRVSAFLGGTAYDTEAPTATGARMKEFVQTLDTVRRGTHFPVERVSPAPSPA